MRAVIPTEILACRHSLRPMLFGEFSFFQTQRFSGMVHFLTTGASRAGALPAFLSLSFTIEDSNTATHAASATFSSSLGIMRDNRHPSERCIEKVAGRPPSRTHTICDFQCDSVDIRFSHIVSPESIRLSGACFGRRYIHWEFISSNAPGAKYTANNSGLASCTLSPVQLCDRGIPYDDPFHTSIRRAKCVVCSHWGISQFSAPVSFLLHSSSRPAGTYRRNPDSKGWNRLPTVYPLKCLLTTTNPIGD